MRVFIYLETFQLTPYSYSLTNHIVSITPLSGGKCNSLSNFYVRWKMQ